jgi:hypothetical protein
MNISLTTDEWQLLVDSVAAIATSAAVIYAIFSGRSNSKHAQKALDEAVERRMDDAMPILERTPLLETSSTDFFEITLTNVGEGKLFNFGLSSPKTGVSVRSSMLQLSNPYKRAYHVMMNFSQMQIQKGTETDSDIDLEYKYNDKYGRKFLVTHRMAVDKDGIISPDFDVDMPRLVGSTSDKHNYEN